MKRKMGGNHKHTQVSGWDKLYREPTKSDHQLSQKAQEALVHYPKENRTKRLLELYYIELKPLKEISEEMGIKYNLIRSRIQKAKKAVIKHFETTHQDKYKNKNLWEVNKSKEFSFMGEGRKVLELLNKKTGEVVWTKQDRTSLSEDVQEILENLDWDYVKLD